MTVAEIHQRLADRHSCSRRQVFRYLKGAQIKPFTKKVKPYPYPGDAVERIMAYLELRGIPSMNQLRDLRRRAVQARKRRAV